VLAAPFDTFLPVRSAIAPPQLPQWQMPVSKFGLPTTGRVVTAEASVGDTVTADQKVAAVEAMKMEHAHLASVSGRVIAIHVDQGDQIDANRVMIEIAAA